MQLVYTTNYTVNKRVHRRHSMWMTESTYNTQYNAHHKEDTAQTTNSTLRTQYTQDTAHRTQAAVH